MPRSCQEPPRMPRSRPGAARSAARSSNSNSNSDSDSDSGNSGSGSDSDSDSSSDSDSDTGRSKWLLESAPVPLGTRHGCSSLLRSRQNARNGCSSMLRSRQSPEAPERSKWLLGRAARVLEIAALACSGAARAHKMTARGHCSKELVSVTLCSVPTR